MFRTQVKLGNDTSHPFPSSRLLSRAFLFALVVTGAFGCGGSAGSSEPESALSSNGGSVVEPVTAPGLTVTANENFAGDGFVDVDKYNQAIDNYNDAGSTLAGGNP